MPRPYLNFGCGGSVHPEWTNLDLAATGPGVIVHDLRLGFPFENESYEAVYGSHVLEHLQPEEAGFVLGECHRVLKPGGIIRLVVPDLEEIARLYLEALDRATARVPGWDRRYDWILLELYDQGVRSRSGGRMAVHIRGELDEAQVRFIESRIGPEVVRQVRRESGEPQRGVGRLGRFLHQPGRAFGAVRKRLAEVCVGAFLGRQGVLALRQGLFRTGGEVHQWMYDRYSLGRALAGATFADVRVCRAEESAIPGFAHFGLESIEGRPRKPDSLYMEAAKRVSAEASVAGT